MVEAFVYAKTMLDFFSLAYKTVHCITSLSLEGGVRLQGWYLRFGLREVGIFCSWLGIKCLCEWA